MLGWWRDLVRVRRASRLSNRASARLDAGDVHEAIALAQHALAHLDPPFTGAALWFGVQGAIRVFADQVLASAAARAGDRASASSAIREWLWLVGEIQRGAPKWKKDEALLRFERWANEYLAWNERSS